MADFNNLTLTVSGIKALLTAQSGTTLTLTKIGMGSGSTNNFTSLTNLITPEVMLPISEKKIDEDSGFMSIVAKMTNEDIAEGFYWRETGLFFEDSDGNNVLFAYACVIDDHYDYVPAYSDKRYVKHVRIADIITDSANITVEENKGLLYVDILTFEEYKEFVEGEFAKKASMITQATTVYVSTSGSDNNDGSETAPLRTIQEAINRCPVITGMPDKDTSEMHYTIFVADGTYSESLRVVGKKMTIETSGTVILTALTVSSAGQVTLKGTFHFSNAGANCVTLYNSKLYCFGTIKVLAGSIGIILAEGSQIVCRSGIIDINNTTWSAIQLGDAGIGYIEELIGSGNTGAGIRCAKAIMWTATNTLATSGTPIIVADGGIVNTGTLNTADKTLYGAVNELHDRPVNNNILINSNFANPVNQRGATEYTNSNTVTNVYTVDRWNILSTDNSKTQKVTVGNDCVSINLSVRGSNFKQIIEFPEKYKGKTLTATCKVKNVVGSGLFRAGEKDGILSQVNLVNGINKVTVTLGESVSHLMVAFLCYETDTFSADIEWVKLEEGEVATPYVPRLYQEEYLLCQRYYQVVLSGSSNLYVVNTNRLGFELAFPIKLRVAPTATFDSTVHIQKNGSTTSETGFTFSFNNISVGRLIIYADKNSHGIAATNLPRITSWVHLDAEL